MKIKSILLFCLLLLSVNVFAQDKIMQSQTEPLKVGQTAPDFSLTDQNGKQIKLSKVKNNVLLVFYRGFW
jgi:cytochrome oxidase Cu insertion factor (SCO1/SenC/PrrC family)